MSVKPAYGFCMIIDVSGAGVTAQEVTVGLLKEKIAVIPGDGLGDVKAWRSTLWRLFCWPEPLA